MGYTRFLEPHGAPDDRRRRTRLVDGRRDFEWAYGVSVWGVDIGGQWVRYGGGVVVGLFDFSFCRIRVFLPCSL